MYRALVFFIYEAIVYKRTNITQHANIIKLRDLLLKKAKYFKNIVKAFANIFQKKLALPSSSKEEDDKIL